MFFLAKYQTTPATAARITRFKIPESDITHTPERRRASNGPEYEVGLWEKPRRPSKRRRSLKIKSVSERLEEFFHMPIEFLFPKELVPEIMERLGKKRTIVHELDLVSLNDVDQKYLTYTMDSQIETSSFYEELYKLLPTLLPREEQCLRLRWGLRDDCDNRTEIIAKCKRQRGEVITVRKVRNPSRRKIYKPIVKEVV